MNTDAHTNSDVIIINTMPFTILLGLLWSSQTTDSVCTCMLVSLNDLYTHFAIGQPMPAMIDPQLHAHAVALKSSCTHGLAS